MFKFSTGPNDEPAGGFAWVSNHEVEYDTFGGRGLRILDTVTGDVRTICGESALGKHDPRETGFGQYPLNAAPGPGPAVIATLVLVTDPNASDRTTILLISRTGRILYRHAAPHFARALVGQDRWLAFEYSRDCLRRKCYIVGPTRGVKQIRDRLRPFAEAGLASLPLAGNGNWEFALYHNSGQFRVASWTGVTVSRGTLRPTGKSGSVRVPNGCNGIDAAIGPDGSSSVILAVRKLAMPAARGWDPPEEYSVWVTRGGAGRVTEIWKRDYPGGMPGFQGSSIEMPGNLTWLPGGSAVSFTARHQLWLYRMPPLPAP